MKYIAIVLFLTASVAVAQGQTQLETEPLVITKADDGVAFGVKGLLEKTKEAYQVVMIKGVTASAVLRSDSEVFIPKDELHGRIPVLLQANPFKGIARVIQVRFLTSKKHGQLIGWDHHLVPATPRKDEDGNTLLNPDKVLEAGQYAVLLLDPATGMEKLPLQAYCFKVEAKE
jgi:hypothetical protein